MFSSNWNSFRANSSHVLADSSQHRFQEARRFLEFFRWKGKEKEVRQVAVVAVVQFLQQWVGSIPVGGEVTASWARTLQIIVGIQAKYCHQTDYLQRLLFNSAATVTVQHHWDGCLQFQGLCCSPPKHHVGWMFRLVSVPKSPQHLTGLHTWVQASEKKPWMLLQNVYQNVPWIEIGQLGRLRILSVIVKRWADIPQQNCFGGW